MILLDVNMPGMDGLETAELIRARRKSAHTPIIFITAFADEMHTARGYSLGAVDYILSPVVPNILRSKVKALVQLHRLNAELKKRSDERVALVKEQAARSVAEDSQRRASFLAEATQVMASSLDVDTILKGAAGLVVPFMADYGAIVLVNEDGSVRAQRSSCVAGWEQYLGAHREVFEGMLARCQAAVIEKGAHDMCDRLTLPPADGDAADDSPLGEIHAFPLVTRGKARGALLLALGPSGRRLAGADLSLADSLAGRAASALDNCLLYEEIQKRRPAQERVPRHAFARAAQPARADACGAAHAALAVGGAGALALASGDHGPAGRADDAPGRGPARHLAHHARRDRAAPRDARRLVRDPQRHRVVPGPARDRRATRSW